MYGSATRLTGSHEIKDVAALLSEPPTCGLWNLAAALGDIDGDGKTDFAVSRQSAAFGDPYQVFVFYGRGQRLSGTVDLATTADAVIAEPGPTGGLGGANAYRVGDVDGDGLADFAVRLPLDSNSLDARIVRGSATRLAGAVALPEGDRIPDLIFADENLHDSNGGVHVIKGRHERLSGAIDPRGPTVLTYVGQPQRVPRCSRGSCVLPEKVGAGVSLGDLTGDHHPDLLIGANSDDYEIVPGPGTAMGHTYVVSAPVIPKP